MNEEIENLQREEAASNVAKATARLGRTERLHRESAEDWAFSIGWATSMSGDPEAIDHHMTALEAVTPADVQRVSAQWLVDSGKTTVLLKEDAR